MTERERPEPPFPEQHLDKPGLESELEPRPRFEAPPYRGADELAGSEALVTGGDSSSITGEVLTLLGGATTAG
ncbi:MAG TPA: hypothetical protein VLB51_02090 [Methylomirabilota bacterium]|nr:hypothetical protein [Methylomirabilota bacterium]